MRDDGDKKCKICKEVSAPARTTPQPGTAAAATARPCATNRRLTHPSSSFPSPGFANLEVLAGAALQTQGGVQKLLRVQGPGRPPGPRPEEQVHEGASRGAQAAQGDEEEGEGRGEAKPATPAMPNRADEPAAKRVKPSEPKRGGDEERERPAEDGDDERPSATKVDGGDGAANVDEPASAAEDDEAMKRQIYVGGIPFYKTEDEIREAFDNENLPVESVDCMTFPDSGRFRGIAIVTFATAEAAKGALAWNNEEWEGKFLVVRKYAPKGGATKADAAKEDATPREEVKKTEGQTIAFIANLDYSITEEQLRTALVGCEVKEVRMGKDKETGEFKGFAHVEFVGDDDLEQAVSLSGTNLMGREMKIAYATARKPPKEDRAPPRFGDKKRGKRDMRHKGDFKKIRRAKRG